MANFSVETDSIRQKASQVESLSQEFASLAARLLSTAESMEPIYTAKDFDVFMGPINECCANLNEVSQKISEAAAGINEQSYNYDGRQDDNSQQAGRLQS